LREEICEKKSLGAFSASLIALEQEQVEEISRRGTTIVALLLLLIQDEGTSGMGQGPPDSVA
jgi:hypothetical protein